MGRKPSLIFPSNIQLFKEPPDSNTPEDNGPQRSLIGRRLPRAVYGALLVIVDAN